MLAVSTIDKISIVPVPSGNDRRRKDMEWSTDHFTNRDLSKYHAAHSLITLLSSDAVHILGVAQGPNYPKLRSVCTFLTKFNLTSSHESSDQHGHVEDIRLEEQMDSILILSPTKILTGHNNGKMCVFDISNKLDDTGYEVPNLEEPSCTVQAHEGPRCAIINMLIVPLSSENKLLVALTKKDDRTTRRTVRCGT